MAFVGKTFNYRSVTAGDDGYLYDLLTGQQNVLFSVSGGNPFSISNNIMTITQCYLIISGRAIRIEQGTTIPLGTIPSSATKGRVIIRLDMTKLATGTTFRQIETEVETTSSTFRALVQQNINSIAGQSNNIYEEAICEFTCSSGTASNPTRSLIANPYVTKKNAVPDIVQYYINQETYSHAGYSVLPMVSRTNLSGDTSFTSVEASNWNVHFNPGIYRMNMCVTFQTSSPTTSDVGIGLGENIIRRDTPLDARVRTTGSTITRLNSSGILEVTNYNDLYSFLIFQGDATERSISGYWSIERIG